MRAIINVTAVVFVVGCASGSSSEGARIQVTQANESDSKPASERPDTLNRRADGDIQESVVSNEKPFTPQPVLVELFTSQGCSSCPPADALLRQIADGTLKALKRANRGQRVIPLSFHVDYWNYIGWRDPYSSNRWSKRQRAYARRVSNGRVYTPQLVIQGRGHAVGSREARIVREIERISSMLPTPPTIELQPHVDDLTLRISVTSVRPEHTAGIALDAWVALFENGISTPVARGENAGRTLQHDRVVRDLRRAFSWATADTTASGEARFSLDKLHLNSEKKLGLVVFLQHPETLTIHGVVELEPASLRALIQTDRPAGG